MSTAPFKSSAGRTLVYDSYDQLVRQWQVEQQSLFIDTSCGRTHVIVSGDRGNPPLVLFHGVGDNSALMWIYNMKELTRHFLVIAVDTLGGPGKSEPNARYTRQFSQSEWLEQLLSQLRIELGLTGLYNIAGVSNGAYLACRSAVLFPDKVERVVCMAGGLTWSMLRMMRTFLPEALFPSEKNTARLLAKLCAPDTQALTGNPELMAHWHCLLKYFDNRLMMAHKNTKLTADEIRVLQPKALFLIGRHDRLSNYPQAIRVLDNSDANYRIIDDAGHAINHEQPERVHEEIIHFLAKKGS
ncbi:alpha/beta hydrolase [Paenibacillaceae bacterium]|nr:alpha/beta hydrolase [Paenibacillaceae bacterium]